MKKIILVCLLLISVAESQHLDWKWINPYPSWNDLYQTTFVDSTTGFIRGMKDIYKTTDKGNIWKKVEINFKHNYISSLYFQNQSTGWMSIDSKLLKTTDCGETWEIMNDTLGGTVQFINAKDGFLSSSSWYDYTFYRTSDGGKTWKYISTFQSKINGEQLTINSNKFLDTLNGFACGSGVTSNGFYYGYIYRTTDGGLTWSKKETTPHYLNSIYFVNDSIGWTTGDYNSLLKTTDRGNNWGTVALDYKDLNLKGIHFSDPKNGIITENDHGALMTSDGGLNWWLMDYTNQSWYNYDYEFSSAYIFKRNDFILCGSHGLIIKKERTNTVNQKGKFGSIRCIDFINENKGFLTAEGGVYYTLNKGEKWYGISKIECNNNDYSGYSFNKVNFGDESTGYLLGGGWEYNGDEWETKLFVSNDSGFTWRCFGFSGKISDFSQPDKDNCWTIDKQGCIMHTTDGGNSWNYQRRPDGNYLEENKIFFLNNKIGWANIGRNLFKTTDEGNNWELIFTNEENYFFSRLFFINPYQGWGVEGYSLYKTVDGGKTWQRGINKSNAILDIKFSDEKRGIFVGEDGMIFCTDDGGKNWTENSLNENDKNFFSVELMEDGTCWVVGDDGAIVTSKLNLTDIEEPKSYESYSFISPNPASDFIEISYPPLERGSRGVGIKIYNIFGQNCDLTPTLSTSGEGVRINVSGLAPGMYFVQIGDRVSKFVKL